MFPYLSLAAGTEASLVEQWCDTYLDSNTLMYYNDTASLMMKHRITPNVGWEGSSKMLDQWLVLPNAILGPPELCPTF